MKKLLLFFLSFVIIAGYSQDDTMAVEIQNLTSISFKDHIEISFDTYGEEYPERIFLQKHEKDAWINLQTLPVRKVPNSFYQALDFSPNEGANAYRIKQIDYDGKVHNSNITEVLFTYTRVKVFPNPSFSILTIKPVPYSVRLVDYAGKEFEVKRVSEDQLDVSSIPEGLYGLILSYPTFTETVIFKKE